jgi:hypothetical protein
MSSSLDFLAETRAISASTNKPFRKIKQKRIINENMPDFYIKERVPNCSLKNLVMPHPIAVPRINPPATSSG